MALKGQSNIIGQQKYSGNGAPNFSASKGSKYVDLLTGDEYKNNSAVSGNTWGLLNIDYTTAGLVSNTEFVEATTGINEVLDSLQTQIVNAKDYTTAGLVYQTVFDSATTGINDVLDDLQSQIVNAKDYTTAGLVYQTEYNNTTSGLWTAISNLSAIDTLKPPMPYNPNITGNYPLDYNGESPQEIYAGDTWRITDAGTMGTVVVNPEDLLIALVDAAGSTTDSDWMVAESNRDQATETVLGLVKKAVQSDIDTGTDNLKYITPQLLKNNIDLYTLTSVFDSATTGINDVLGDLQSQIVNAKDYTTAGLVFQTEFDSATTGIHERIDLLESSPSGISDVVAGTSGLMSVTKDGGTATIDIIEYQDILDFDFTTNDHTTAGYGSANQSGTQGLIQFNNTSNLGSSPNLKWDNENNTFLINNPASSTATVTIKADNLKGIISEYLDELENPILEVKKDGSIKLYETSDTITDDNSIFLDSNSEYMKLIKDTVEYYLNVDKLTMLRDVELSGVSTGDVLVSDNGTFGNLGSEEFNDTIFRKSINISSNQQLPFDIPSDYEIMSIKVKNVGSGSCGLSLGTSSGGVEIVDNVNSPVGTVVYSLSRGTVGTAFFSDTQDTELWISSSAWGSAIVNIYFKFSKLSS